ncbi:MAG TPA: PilN domain-containing protein [Acidobacteriota bacterium]|nr:PilN domain-containing protein [Acidobacteriota bacterium]
MIKINLLREPRKTQPRWSFEQSQVGIYAVILMILAVVGMAWWYWSLLGQRTELTATLENLQQENLRLQVVRGELEKFERQRRLLDDRIAVIDRLKANQKGPVLLMNAVIASIPPEPRLWLDSVNQKESQVIIKGQALDVTAIADFISRLSTNRPFQQVELNSYEERNDRIVFELTCQIAR